MLVVRSLPCGDTGSPGPDCVHPARLLLALELSHVQKTPLTDPNPAL